MSFIMKNGIKSSKNDFISCAMTSRSLSYLSTFFSSILTSSGGSPPERTNSVSRCSIMVRRVPIFCILSLSMDSHAVIAFSVSKSSMPHIVSKAFFTYLLYPSEANIVPTSSPSKRKNSNKSIGMIFKI